MVSKHPAATIIVTAIIVDSQFNGPYREWPRKEGNYKVEKSDGTQLASSRNRRRAFGELRRTDDEDMYDLSRSKSRRA